MGVGGEEEMSELHMHLNNIPHELGKYAVLLIGRDGNLLTRTILDNPYKERYLDLILLEGKKLWFSGAIDIDEFREEG